MFQPNSLRALRELKLDKELEKNTLQFQNNESQQVKHKQSRSISNVEQNIEPENFSNSDFSEDENSLNDQKRPKTTSGNIEGGHSRGQMSNTSEYFQKMKSLLEKNPYHPMNFVFDHKDLLNELTQFIQETREWRETQKKELEQQLEYNKQRAVTSLEHNEELQKKIKEQQEFEAYLEKVQQIQEEYNSDIKNYQKYMKKKDNKENRPLTGNVSESEKDNKELLKLIEDSKKKVSQIENIDEYIQKAQIEVEYNKMSSDTQNRLNEDEKLNNDINNQLIVGISEWEKQVDELLFNLNTQPNDVKLTSHQRIQSARQDLKKDYQANKDEDIEKELEELDKEFQELEDMLESAQEVKQSK